tara:strand:+ start:1309 stop:2664 length:1356 start_codon:yes stop_codon:yes gene_type:complete
MIKDYQETTEYLDSFINYEKISFYPYKISLKSQRMVLLLKHLEIDTSNLKVIHIAGTKGKGSTAYFCAWILASLGFKVGLYTSPHLFDFRERIQIVKNLKSKVTNLLISKKEVCDITAKIKPHLDQFNLPEELGEVSFFEVYTALAFKYFLEKKTDFVVLETGLGGRLDATNVIKPLVSIITHIGYDHTDHLGANLADIAYEKAGIIKEKVPLVLGHQQPSALKVIRQRAEKLQASLHMFGRDFKVKNIKFKAQQTLFDYKFKQTLMEKLKIILKGAYQVENAACAITAINLLKEKKFLKVKNSFKKGLESCDLLGRFQVKSDDPLVVLDIAHNASSFLALKNNLKIYFPGKEIILIFACSKDKNAEAMLKTLKYSYLILTPFSNPRSWDPRAVKETTNIGKTFIAPSVEEAIDRALSLYKSESLILISGSLFLVSQAWIYMEKTKSGVRV